MAQDATGTVTSPDGILKYNTAADAPSGKGLNNIVDSIQAALTAGFARKPSGILTGEVPVWNGSAWVRSSVTKVAATSLAIPLVTTSTWAGGPPGSPTTGDIWIATAVDANGVCWQFQYDNAQTTYKWVFIGGSSVRKTDVSGQTVGLSTWAEIGPTGNVRYTVLRGGDYECECDIYGAGSTGGAGTQTLGIGTAAGGSPAAVDQFLTQTSTSSAYSIAVEARLNSLATSTDITTWIFSNIANATTLRSHLRVKPVRII